MRILKKFLRILAILLPVFCVFFISSDSYAETQTLTYYTGETMPSSFPFDFTQYSSSPLYFSWSCSPNSSYNGSDRSLYVRPQNGIGISFSALCRRFSSDPYVAIFSGMMVFDYIPSAFGLYSSTVVTSDIDSFIFTLSDELPGSSGSSPSGSLSITSNGTYDVTSYAEAVVDVPAEQLPGDYDDEFNGVITAIYICGASAIMIYFFYIIYGIFIKPTGGQR